MKKRRLSTEVVAALFWSRLSPIGRDRGRSRWLRRLFLTAVLAPVVRSDPDGGANHNGLLDTVYRLDRKRRRIHRFYLIEQSADDWEKSIRIIGRILYVGEDKVFSRSRTMSL
ncbi:MAG: hypothetical protein AAGG48_04290 [Planctomycetota bacterium]